MKMPIMKKAVLIILVLSLIPLSGCWNRRELKSLSVCPSILYDLTDDGSVYTTLELVKPEESGGAGGGGGDKAKTSTVTWVSQGHSVPSALRQSSDTIERKIYFAHMQARLFSEKFASKSIFSEMDFFLRDQELRQTAYLFVVRGDNPQQVYQASTGFATDLGSYIESLAESNRKANSTGVFVKTLDFMRCYYEDGREPVTGVLQIEANRAVRASESGDESQGQDQTSKKYILNCAGLAAFKGEKLVGFMNGTEARAYNLVINQAGSAFIPIKFSDGDTVIEIIDSKSKVKTSFEDDTPIVDIHLKMNINIAQEAGTKNLRKNATYDRITKAFDRQMEDQIKAAVKKAQTQFNSDIFGFGTYMHQQNPKVWNKIRNDWGKYFGKCKVTVTVDSTIKRIGEIKQPFKLEE